MAFSPKRKKTVQVRLSKGGGTRTIRVDRHSKADTIHKTARKLFFPDDNSKCLGNIDNFETALLDFCKNEVDVNMTVEEMYDTAKVNKLRFYLSLLRKDEPTYSDPDSEVEFQLSDEGDNGYISSRLRNNVTNDHQEPSTSSGVIADTSESTDISTYLSSFIQEELLVETPPPTLLILHRGKIFDELLADFKQHSNLINIQIEMILPKGQREVAEDLGGVLRDALTEFWEMFYAKCTVGTTLKVPCLRDDFGSNEWEAVARIIGLGYSEQRYFPIRLAPVFVMNCMGYTFEDDDVVNDFLEFVSESEAEMLKNAMHKFEEADMEEMLDFFSNYNSKRLVTKDNLKTVLIGVAQKELIQKPEFVSKCFSRTGELNKVIDIKSIYSLCQPTPKNILRILEIHQENPSPEALEVFNYLKKYIREADSRTRSAFLRFSTGSDIVNREIVVTFNDTSGFLRIPVAHTCSCILELQNTYENFMAFRSELNNVLSSNIWVMDIV